MVKSFAGVTSMIGAVHILTAVLFAALAPTLVVGFLGAFLPTFVSSTFVVAAAHALLLGLPLVLWFHAKGKVSAARSVIGGFIVGAAGVAVLFWPMRSMNMQTSAWSGPDRVATMIDGIPTIAGWTEYLSILGLFGLLGVIGGAAFWAVYRRLCLAAEHPAYVETSGAKRIGLPVFAGFASVLIVSLPWALADRSCHNPMRDGRSRISPVVNINLDLDHGDWPALIGEFESFASERGMSFRNQSDDPLSPTRSLYLSVCSESGVTISVNEYRSARVDDPWQGYGIGVPVYESNSGSGWQQEAMALIDRLEQRWPGKVRFRDGDGRLMPKPAELSKQLP